MLYGNSSSSDIGFHAFMISDPLEVQVVDGITSYHIVSK